MGDPSSKLLPMELAGTRQVEGERTWNPIIAITNPELSKHAKSSTGEKYQRKTHIANPKPLNPRETHHR